MKKRKFTRRQKALLSIAFLAVILTANILSRNYGFTQAQALKRTGEYYATGELEKLYELDSGLLFGRIIGSHGLYYNDNALGHIALRFIPSIGWHRDGSCIIDLSETQPAYIGCHTYSDSKSEERYTVLFGCVDDERISSVKINYAAFDEYGYAQRDETKTVTITDFTEHKGKRYFCAEQTYVPDGRNNNIFCVKGNVL